MIFPLKPIGEYVLVKCDANIQQISGIWIPKMGFKTRSGEIIKIGNRVKSVKIGDKVKYPRKCGCEFEDTETNKQFILLNENDLEAVEEHANI